MNLDTTVNFHGDFIWGGVQTDREMWRNELKDWNNGVWVDLI